MTDFTVRPAETADQPVVERLWHLFRHDMSAYNGQLPLPDASFRADRLRAAFTEPGWAAYLFIQEDRPAGFAFVRNLDGPGPTVLNSFFLVHAARRRGNGLAAARDVLARHPGDWEISYQDANLAAVAFWPRVAIACADEAGLRIEHRPAPGRPDLPQDAWICFTVLAR